MNPRTWSYQGYPWYRVPGTRRDRNPPSWNGISFRRVKLYRGSLLELMELTALAADIANWMPFPFSAREIHADISPVLSGEKATLRIRTPRSHVLPPCMVYHSRIIRVLVYHSRVFLGTPGQKVMLVNPCRCAAELTGQGRFRAGYLMYAAPASSRPCWSRVERPTYKKLRPLLPLAETSSSPLPPSRVSAAWPQPATRRSDRPVQR